MSRWKLYGLKKQALKFEPRIIGWQDNPDGTLLLPIYPEGVTDGKVLWILKSQLSIIYYK